MNRVWTTVLVLALAVVAAPARSETSIVLPKPGQVGLSIGGGYGTFLETGNVGSTFSAGGSFNLRLRYRMRYERGFGLSFESQKLDVRRQPPVYVVGDESTVGPTQLSAILSGAEFYQMFGTRTVSTRMVMIGAGLAQMRADTNTGETELSGKDSGDGLFVSAGAGVERFFFRSWAWDLSSRYYAVFRDGQANHNLQAALGLIFYASY
ncbi:MAG: hypothetical protein E6K80_07230 [Candidatus Eisenbacteria bacterium]|uniref:Outer membrane protein beta-barrel domain-containing protein n=1 Tax=Eiseniibacteriota bacterium TaxID=2212470 RepID=A0A538U4N3_UNCEI|nr:MAG: hypothetical protein E6K80_07230 [Candidatus Eisenbacteria bacterium]